MERLMGETRPPCEALNFASSAACLCTGRALVWWYPCGWKLCRNPEALVPDAGAFLSGQVKCGIRACRFKYTLAHPASDRAHCPST